MINGLAHKVQYNQATIDNLFLPFLRRMSKMQQKLGRRMIIFLAAPPGVGKSTLTLLLEQLSNTDEELVPLQALGLDGFHYPNTYLNTHSVEREGKLIPMSSIKGSPETFSVDKLIGKLTDIRKNDVRWPIYDRSIHDIVEEIVTVRKNLIILEGNWLLLGEDRWQNVRSFADYSLFISAEPADLKERLIRRKMAGGSTMEAAKKFYQKSDKLNVERCLKKSWPADETWHMLPDGDYQLKGKIVPTRMIDRNALWKKPNVQLDNTLLGGLNNRNAGQGIQPPLYDEGYAHGMEEARKAILRKLYESGTMSSKAILDTFQVTAEELSEIIK
ncbi:nucleoside/nucleotide kinase family protein [Selenomonas ruminantium]|uniref:nucleoside/nucleotide kinase family protein n=1 Tax=Selenomonas ruminantium TaxID=971 RepID=UPI0026F259F3|nr:nucleoside/nucleotide kinase family protein [Selenomonas ruminantium]